MEMESSKMFSGGMKKGIQNTSTTGYEMMQSNENY